MCYEPVALTLAGAVILLGVLGNFNSAWTLFDGHGGIWMFCPDRVFPKYTTVKNMPDDASAYVKGDCYKYTESVADNLYNHEYVEITAAKALLLVGTILGLPIMIIVGFQIFDRVPFYAGGIVGVFQFICLLVSAALITHGFNAGGNDGTQLGFNGYAVWIAAILSLIVTIIIFTSKSKCWDRCRGKKLDENKEESPDSDDTSTKPNESSPKTDDENSSLLGNEARKTLTSDLASQSSGSTVDEMPEVAPSYSSRKSSSGKSSSTSGSTNASKTVVQSTKPGKESSNSIVSESEADGTQSTGSRSVIGSEAGKTSKRKKSSTQTTSVRPATIEEESEIATDDIQSGSDFGSEKNSDDDREKKEKDK